jgi:hypothetical protein
LPLAYTFQKQTITFIVSLFNASFFHSFRRNLDGPNDSVIVWPSTPVPPRIKTVYPYIGFLLEILCVVASVLLWVCAFAEKQWVQDHVLSRFFGYEEEEDAVRQPLLARDNA